MPDRELLLEYQTVMQNTRVIQLYGELLAFMRETARATADLRGLGGCPQSSPASWMLPILQWSPLPAERERENMWLPFSMEN